MTKPRLIITAIMLFGIVTANAQPTDTTTTSTNIKSKALLNTGNNDDYSGFEILQPAIDSGYRVYFTGENHTYTGSNSELQLKMFKYLHQTAGVNTLFMEFGYSRGWLVNEYIQTGDSSMLDILRGYSFTEFATMYKGLKEYNETLPDDNKVKVIGIDVERHFSLAIKTMCMMLPDNDAPEEISFHVESLKSISGYYDESAKDKVESEDEEKPYKPTGRYLYNTTNTMEDIIKNFVSNDSIYKTYLGDKYDVFKKIMIGLKDREVWNDYTSKKMPQAFIYRERYMYQEFMSHLKSNPNDKFFAQFGRCHVSVVPQEEACSWYEYNSIAYRLNNSSDTSIRGKVCSIAIFYPNEPSYKSDDNAECITSIIESAPDSGMTLFKLLPGTDSCSILSERYQYIIVSRSQVNPNYFSYNTYQDLINQQKQDDKSGYIFSLSYYQRGYSFNNLNNHLATLPTSPKHPEELNGFGLSYQRITYSGYSTKFNFMLINGNDVNLDNSTKISFKSRSFSLLLGKDLFKSSYFDFVPHIGFRYGEMNLTFESDTAVTPGSTNLFGEPVTVNYSNPYTAIEGNLTIQYRISGRFGIGADIGYLVDISRQGWKQDGESVEKAPSQSASGFYAGVSILFSLK